MNRICLVVFSRVEWLGACAVNFSAPPLVWKGWGFWGLGYRDQGSGRLEAAGGGGLLHAQHSPPGQISEQITVALLIELSAARD